MYKLYLSWIGLILQYTVINIVLILCVIGVFCMHILLLLHNHSITKTKSLMSRPRYLFIDVLHQLIILCDWCAVYYTI